jgi:uncharacterized membrane protein YfcA
MCSREKCNDFHYNAPNSYDPNGLSNVTHWANLPKLPIKKAVGTSLFIIAMNSLIGFIGDVQNIAIDWIFLLTFTSISIVGIFIGIYLNKYVNEVQLKKGFAYFVLLMAVFILFKEF